MLNNLLEDLFTAYFDARRNKRNTINALSFELNYESNLFRLYEEIDERNYKIARSICFINFDPVQREIFAADFRDRIVHHLVFNYINPIFDKTFINDSYSCRKNRGTHYGIKRIRRFISQCSNNYAKDCYIMKLDIEGYFMKMDREILYQKITDVLRQKRDNLNCDTNLLKYLLQKIIFNDPTINCNIRGKKSDWKGLPESKSLFCAEDNKGFPIGNLTSQLFGNIYLNEFDHFVKDELKIKYYGRYVDDCVLVHQDKHYLLECRERIRNYLKKRLALTLHPKKFYLQHYFKGVQFLGACIKPYRIYIGKRCKTNFYRKISDWNGKIKIAKDGLSEDQKIECRANINSYLGLMKHYNTYKLRKKIILKPINNSFLKFFKVPESLDKIILR
ncbi:MAG: group II intron reverse transcriptase domain-containing protein [Ignavibacteriales bacterium]|nr:group II intron reverse transcriptase domain-containing protein [Ignavibacteriales bacterium]